MESYEKVLEEVEALEDSESYWNEVSEVLNEYQDAGIQGMPGLFSRQSSFSHGLSTSGEADAYKEIVEILESEEEDRVDLIKQYRNNLEVEGVNNEAYERDEMISERDEIVEDSLYDKNPVDQIVNSIFKTLLENHR